MRRLIWFALAGQVAFVLAWVVAGQLESDYNHARQYISELGAETAESPGLVNTALALFGLTLAALGAALWAVLPARGRRVAPVLLFGAAGLGFVVAGLTPLECETTVSEACERRFDDGELSTATYVHAWAGFWAQITFLLTPFAIAWALWPGLVARLSLLAGLIGLVIFALFWLAGAGDDPGDSAGLAQRLGLAVIHTWSGLVAVAILLARSARPA